MPKRKQAANTTANTNTTADGSDIERKLNTVASADGVDVYTSKIYMLVDEYIDTLRDPEDIYKTNTFTGLIHYIYNHYIGDLLDNKHYSAKANRYNDIKLLDNLFSIYIDLTYKYNQIPYILEFCIFIGISRDTINTWKNNFTRDLTSEYSDTAKKWYQTCELAQVKEKDVKSIFLLKSNFGYNDNLAAIPREEQPRSIQADALPVLNIAKNGNFLEYNADGEQ